jgi:hypothetical protein
VDAALVLNVYAAVDCEKELAARILTGGNLPAESMTELKLAVLRRESHFS